MVNNPLILILVGASLLSSIQGAKILFLLPCSSKSHVNVFEPLIRALGERGHDVTNMSPVNSSGMPPSVKQVITLTISEVFKDYPDPFAFRKQGKTAQFTNTSIEHMEKACEDIIDHPLFKQVMETQTFDLIIVDIMLNYCVLGVLAHYKAPTIYLTTMVAPSYISDVVGNRLPPSFVPNPFLDYTHEMTFWERVINFSFDILFDFLGKWVFLPKFEKIYQEKLGIPDTVSQMSSNISMIFMNSHFTLTYPRPLLPDVVEVGGMHVGPAKHLPKVIIDEVKITFKLI
jgi:glucuronosyltransferase